MIERRQEMVLLANFRLLVFCISQEAESICCILDWARENF
jgi:hypothetical protein